MQLTQISKEEQVEIISFVENLDFLDILILKKFYMSGDKFPNDLKTYCFPLLYKEMKEKNHLKIGLEAFRKRLNNLVKLGLLEKIEHSNPVCFLPVKGKEEFVRIIITKFFLIYGLMNFSNNL